MPSQLNGRKVAFLATDGVEQVELTAPWNALKQAGADTVLVSDKTGEIQAMNHDTKGERFKVDVEVSKVSARGAWVDKQVQPDQKLLTARKPDDLPAFCAQLVDLLESAIEERRLDKMVEQSFPASDPLPGPISLA